MYPILIRHRYDTNRNLFIKMSDEEVQNISMNISNIDINNGTADSHASYMEHEPEPEPDTVCQQVAEPEPDTVCQQIAEQEPDTVCQQIAEPEPEPECQQIAEPEPDTVCAQIAELEQDDTDYPIDKICIILVNNTTIPITQLYKQSTYINITRILVRDKQNLYTFAIESPVNIDKQMKTHLKTSLNIKTKNISKIVYAGQYQNCATYIIGITNDKLISRLTTAHIPDNDISTYAWHCMCDYYNPMHNVETDLYTQIINNTTALKNDHLSNYLLIASKKIYIQDIYSLYYESV